MIELLAQTAPEASASPIIWAFVFLGIAIILFIAELFVPSGGLIAVIGGLSVVASLIAFYTYDINTGLIATGTYMVLGPIMAWFAFKLWVSSPLAKQMILGGIVSEDREEAKQIADAQQRERLDHWQHLVGKTGVTLSVLRPVGVVRINGERIDAIAETGSIEADTPIIVVSATDNQLKVRRTASKE
jgi:membrane-bound serine protease (ClpP class)